MNKLQKALTHVPPLYSAFNYLNKIRITGTLTVAMLPQDEKRKLILDYAKTYTCNVFVETGTYKGDTLEACRSHFKELYSIELSPELFRGSRDRFVGVQNIHIYEGNSGELLPEIVKKINEPALFWLDAHYSGGETAQGPEDSPIVKELDFLLNYSAFNNCILIDDARCFNGKSGYPRINVLRRMIEEKNKKDGTVLQLQVKNDIIRIAKEI